MGDSSRSVPRRLLKKLRRGFGRRDDKKPSQLEGAVAEVERSGAFDHPWYERQVGRSFASGREAITHYLEAGWAAGFEPAALFCSRTYSKQYPAAARGRYGPFVHYLRHGTRRGASPHPVFDVEHYRSQSSVSKDHPGGDLGHFLTVGEQQGLTVNAWFDADVARAAAENEKPRIVDFVERVSPGVHAVPDHRHLARLHDDLEVAASDRATAPFREMASDATGLVTVIMSIDDRSPAVGAAIASVLVQTYRNLELIVIADGSIDTIGDEVASFDDPRVTLLSRGPGGAASARNVGLGRASGEYVAYLDGDRRWASTFLQVLVQHIQSSQCDAAYAALKVIGPSGVAYRGTPIELSSLLEVDYIDINSLVHRRAIVDRIGPWDEDLPRAIDWDFVLRLAREGTLDYVPVIGVFEDHASERDDRIDVRELFGHGAAVYAKHHFDWSAGQRAPVDGRVSVVIWHTGRIRRLAACIGALGESTRGQDVEIIVVDDSKNEEHLYRLLGMQQGYQRLRIVRHTRMRLTATLALNYGILHATGEIVVLVDQCASVQTGWLNPLIAPLRASEASATQQVLRTPADAVAAAGYLVSPDGLPYPALRGMPGDAEILDEAAERSCLSRGLLAARRADLVAVQGLDARYRVAFADADLTIRLRAATGLPAMLVPGPGAVMFGSPSTYSELVRDQDQAEFLKRWQGSLIEDESPALARADLRIRGRRPVGLSDQGPDVHEPILDSVRDRGRRLRWAIKVAVPDVNVRYRWGDTHFAEGLKSALQRRGHEVAIDLHGAWYRAASDLDDIVIVLRGTRRYRPNPHQVNLIWVISHPDLCSDAELSRFDQRFAASRYLAQKYTRRTGMEVRTLMQCTDVSRFQPLRLMPVRDEILFVGNSRKVRRPIVDDAIAAGLNVRVYGAHWEDLIPPQFLAGQFIPNAQVSEAYAAAGVVLNDHWDDMRREHLLSNRLFDLAACGANVVSDDVPGIDEVFGPVIRIYQEPSQLRKVVGEALARRDDEYEARVQLATTVRANHSFDVRARTLEQAAQEVLASRK